MRQDIRVIQSQTKVEGKDVNKDPGSESDQLIKSRAHVFSIFMSLGSGTMPGMESMPNKYLVTD